MEKHIQIMSDHTLKMLFISLIVMMSTTQVHSAELVNITYLESAVAKGAVCIDGSPPAYYYAPGSGDGAANWVVYLEGGGWCAYGFCNTWIKYRTTKNRTSPIELHHILDANQTSNSDFYNWNRVYVAYCDGGSFSGDVESDPHYSIPRRGARIFNAVMEDLVAKGMKNAKNAILTGTSAGGLATILNCDRFRAVIPNASRLKCIADGGFFIRGKSDDLPADDKRAAVFDSVVQFHNLTNFLPASCTSKMLPSSCMFPENFVNDIKTPLFLLQSTMDFYQMETGLTNDMTYNTTWTQCVETLQNCTDYQIGLFKGFRSVFLKTVQGLGNPPPSRGMYVHSCVIHGHFFTFPGWNISPIRGIQGVPKAIGDWYFDRSTVQAIDTRDDVEPAVCTLSI